MIGLFSNFSGIVASGHEKIAIKFAHVLASLLPFVKDLLPNLQGPVEAGTVVVHQLGVGNLFTDGVDELGHFADMRIRSFNPKQIGAIFQTCDAVQNGAIEPGVGLELVQAIGKTIWNAKFSVHFDESGSILEFVNVVDGFEFQEIVVPEK